MKKITFRNLVMAGMILWFAGCGGGGADNGAEASLSPDSSLAQRRLVADFSDASFLLRPSYLGVLKGLPGGDKEATEPDTPSPEDSSGAERDIELIFLEKWTTADEIKPALYVTESEAEDAGAGGEPVEGDETTPPADSADDIVLDGLIGGIDDIRTYSSGLVYFTLVPPLKYNQGKSCAFFVVDKTDKITCVDGDAHRIDIIGVDGNGNIYYRAYNSEDITFRKKALADGSIVEMGGVAAKELNEEIYETQVNPSGDLLVTSEIEDHNTGRDKYEFRKLTVNGEEKLTLPDGYTIPNHAYELSGDGKLIFSGYKKETDGEKKFGIFSLQFGSTEPVILIDRGSRLPSDSDYNNYSSGGLFWSESHNLWLRTADGMCKVDTNVPTSPELQELEDNVLPFSVFGDYKNHYSVKSANVTGDSVKIYKFSFGDTNIVSEKILETVFEFYTRTSRPLLGRDNRVFLVSVSATNNYSEALHYLTYKAADGSLKTVLMPLTDMVYGFTAYSLQ